MVEVGVGYKLSKGSLQAALKHLCRFGDTDIFPHLPELAFFRDEEVAVIESLEKLDLDTYTPQFALEGLTPKGRLGFRIAHQLDAVDNLLFLACVIEIGEKIEAYRQPRASRRAFSYRFEVSEIPGSIFATGHKYRELAPKFSGHGLPLR